MPQRIRTRINGADGLLPGHFRAKWGGVCGVCKFGYEKGEVLHYVGRSPSHETCQGPYGTGGLIPRRNDFDDHGHAIDPEPSFVKIGGAKDNPPCKDCFLIHPAGKCDE